MGRPSARGASFQTHCQSWVREISAVPGRTEGDVVELEPIFVLRNERLVRADGYPPHPDRFERLGYDLSRLLATGYEGAA